MPTPVSPLKDESANVPSDKKIFIECTHTSRSHINTGVQRVVRNILMNAPAVAAQYGYQAIPVIWKNSTFIPIDLDRFRTQTELYLFSQAVPPLTIKQRIYKALSPIYNNFRHMVSKALPGSVARKFLYAPPNSFGLSMCLLLPWRFAKKVGLGVNEFSSYLCSLRELIGYKPIDSRIANFNQYRSHQDNILLLLDSSWHLPIERAVRRFTKKGGRVAGVIYDLIPVTHPHTCVPSLAIDFQKWLVNQLENVDVFIAISKTIRDQMEDYCSKQKNLNGILHPVKFGYFYLGSELDLIREKEPPRQHIHDIFDNNPHTFMMVGSIEPRKNVPFVLDAFDLHWNKGGEGALIIIGKNSWKSDAFLKRVSMHPLLNKKIFLLRDVNDGELDYAYHNASALIFASFVEGFGLPIVEAFQRGLPVLCSDIPVFREIAEGRATFFDINNPENLANALYTFCLRHIPGENGQRAPYPWITWKESTEQLFSQITTNLP